MCDITEIREKVFKKTDAQRLVIKVHTERLDSQDYRVSVNNFINEIFPNWEDDHRIRFIATGLRAEGETKYFVKHLVSWILYTATSCEDDW